MPKMKATLPLVVFTLFTLISSGQNNLAQSTKNDPYFKFPSNLTAADYLPKTILFKVKPEFRSICEPTRIDILD